MSAMRLSQPIYTKAPDIHKITCQCEKKKPENQTLQNLTALEKRQEVLNYVTKP